jgi:hypothetical protein
LVRYTVARKTRKTRAPAAMSKRRLKSMGMTISS